MGAAPSKEVVIPGTGASPAPRPAPDGGALAAAQAESLQPHRDAEREATLRAA